MTLLEQKIDVLEANLESTLNKSKLQDEKIEQLKVKLARLVNQPSGTQSPSEGEGGEDADEPRFALGAPADDVDFKFDNMLMLIEGIMWDIKLGSN